MFAGLSGYSYIQWLGSLKIHEESCWTRARSELTVQGSPALIACHVLQCRKEAAVHTRDFFSSVSVKKENLTMIGIAQFITFPAKLVLISAAD